MGLQTIRIIAWFDIFFAVAVIAQQSFLTTQYFPDPGPDFEGASLDNNNNLNVTKVVILPDQNPFSPGIPFGTLFLLFMLVVMISIGSTFATLALIISTERPIRVDSCKTLAGWLIFNIVTVLAALGVLAVGFRTPMIVLQCFVYISVRLMLAIVLAQNYVNLILGSSVTYVDPNYRTWEEKLNDFLESEGLTEQTCRCQSCTETLIHHMKIEEAIMNTVLSIDDPNLEYVEN